MTAELKLIYVVYDHIELSPAMRRCRQFFLISRRRTLQCEELVINAVFTSAVIGGRIDCVIKDCVVVLADDDEKRIK